MEEISLGYRSKESRQQRSGGSPTKVLVGKDLLKELEQRRSSPSVVAKLMGIDVLPLLQVPCSKNQEFKDVYEVSEPSVVTKEKNRHVGKGLPSLKRSTLKLKKLVPAMSTSHDGTSDYNVEWRDGLDRLNAIERNNPLFEKHPHNSNYSPNHHFEKNAASASRKHPVGLSHSSLRQFRSSSHHESTTIGKYDSFSSIVVLEPCLEKAHYLENIGSDSYLSDVSKICSGEGEQKQSEFSVLQNGRISQHFLDAEDFSVSRVRREKCLTDDSVGPPHLKGQNSLARYGNFDTNSSQPYHRYTNSGHSTNPNQSNKISSNSFSGKIIWQYEDADGGSRTLAEMFALSDTEKPNKTSGSHARLGHDKPDHGNGRNKEGCFIVLPKYAPYSYPPPLHSHISWNRNAAVSDDDLHMPNDTTSLRDANSSREGSPQIGNFPKTSSGCNGGRFQFDFFPDEPRLLKQKTSITQENLRNVVGVKRLTTDKPKPASPSHVDSRRNSWHLVDNFSSPDCTNERVLFTTDESQGLVRKIAETTSSAKEFQCSAEKQKATSSFQCQEDESVTHLDHVGVTKPLKGSKGAEQPSPVSILEPPTDEDSCCSGYFKYDVEGIPNIQKQLDDLEFQDEYEVSMSSDDNDDSTDLSLEAFRVEEDREFSYLLDMLIGSGIIVSNLEFLCSAWYSPGCPISPHVFDRLERKYSKIAPTWARPERRLLFDHVNSVLCEVLSPCTITHPWVVKSRAQIVRPIWGPEGPVERLWQMLIRQREELAVGCPDDKVLDTKWLEVGDGINMMGKLIGRMLHDDLVEEAILEFLSDSVAS